MEFVVLFFMFEVLCVFTGWQPFLTGEPHYLMVVVGLTAESVCLTFRGLAVRLI